MGTAFGDKIMAQLTTLYLDYSIVSVGTVADE